MREHRRCLRRGVRARHGVPLQGCGRGETDRWGCVNTGVVCGTACGHATACPYRVAGRSGGCRNRHQLGRLPRGIVAEAFVLDEAEDVQPLVEGELRCAAVA
jgi:hypothetical protein